MSKSQDYLNKIITNVATGYDAMDDNNTEPINALVETINNLHGCNAKRVESVARNKTFQDQVIWKEAVQVFDLRDHLTAKKCNV